jgi:4-amino-4-deoxy-L-arabinose transferase-like glycosyltransferase
MELSLLENFLESRRTVWIVGAFTIVLFLTANLPWQLDDYDQAKQAFTSFEMIKEARWFYHQTPHAHVATKPPLIGWISAGLFELTRSWDLAWRLPSFLAAVAVSILLFRAAVTAYGSVAALIALSAFGLNLLSLRLATLVRTDMPLTLVIFLIGLLIWQKVRHGEPWNKRDHLLVFVLLTGAMLIKGPIVWMFLLPGIGIFEWRRRSNNGPSVWCGWSPWVASLGVFLLWVVGGIVLQPGFCDEVVVREFVARFGETIHRSQPIYFYLPHLFHKFLPWSALIIAVAVLDLRSRGWKIRAAFREISPETFWLLCWSLGGLLAMSLIPSKRVDRIFPVLPPLCLLLAAQVGKCAVCSHGSVSPSSTSLDVDRTGHRPVATENGTTRTRVYRWTAVALLLSILVTGGYTISKVVSGYRDHHDALVIFGRNVCHQAEMRHWRYEALSAKDEGLLLYLQKTHFIASDRAIVEWNGGNLDALVVPTDKAPPLMRDLHDAVLSQLKSNERSGERGQAYVLITR